MAGLHKPTAGQVLLDGVSVPDLPPHLSAQKIAYLPQSRNVPEITALRMVLHGRFAYLSVSPPAAGRRIMTLPVGRWSGSEQGSWQIKMSRRSRAVSGRRSISPWPWPRIPIRC